MTEPEHLLTLCGGRGADALTIGTRIVREKMNPLFLSPERFVVATPSAESKEVLGFGQLRPAPGVAWELASLVVEPEHRGQGIGSGILRTLLSQHRASSASEERVCLLTLRSTRGFYERLGFAEIGEDADGGRLWVLDVTRAPEARPHFIEIVENP